LKVFFLKEAYVEGEQYNYHCRDSSLDVKEKDEGIHHLHTTARASPEGVGLGGRQGPKFWASSQLYV
jgi:hypothetical protein